MCRFSGQQIIMQEKVRLHGGNYYSIWEHEPKMPSIRLLNQKQRAKNIVTYHRKERKPVRFVTGNNILINITWGLKQHWSSKIVISISHAPLFRK